MPRVVHKTHYAKHQDPHTADSVDFLATLSGQWKMAVLPHGASIVQAWTGHSQPFWGRSLLANVVSGLVWRGGGAVSPSGLRRGMWLLGYIGAGYTVRAGIWLSVNSHCPDCPDATLAMGSCMGSSVWFWVMQGPHSFCGSLGRSPLGRKAPSCLAGPDRWCYWEDAWRGDFHASLFAVRALKIKCPRWAAWPWTTLYAPTVKSSVVKEERILCTMGIA